MKAFASAALLVVVFTTQGCASSEPKLEDDMAALKSQVWSLQKQTSELGLKISYNSDELALLSERLEMIEKTLNSLSKSGAASPEPAQPPAPEGEPGSQEQTSVPEPAPSMMAGEAADALGSDFKDLDAENMYKRAMERFNEGDYDSAISGFNYMVRRYPGSGLASSAQYWVGESFYSLKRYARAVEEFRMILSRYPRSPKTPDALLKIGLCKFEIGKRDEGEKFLKRVIEEYPNSAAASTAGKLLSEAPGIVEQQ
ncbi:MAG: tol-pal system protein YbgF [Candidatus Nitrospinota bacterium M3_3B_026]